jgi:ABC-type hemin transport system substrate-binding protein
MIRERVGRLHRHAQTLLQEMKQQVEEVEAALAQAEVRYMRPFFISDQGVKSASVAGAGLGIAKGLRMLSRKAVSLAKPHSCMQCT